MGCRLTDRWWKVLLAAVLAMGLTATGFFVGFGMASSPSSTVYSIHPAGVGACTSYLRFFHF